MQNETILNVFPTADERHRLVIAVQQCPVARPGCDCIAGSSKLVLRQETFSPDVGWFVQSCVAVEPEQLPGLKMALTSTATRSIQPVPRKVPRVPAILRFDGAETASVG